MNYKMTQFIFFEGIMLTTDYLSPENPRVCEQLEVVRERTIVHIFKLEL